MNFRPERLTSTGAIWYRRLVKMVIISVGVGVLAGAVWVAVLVGSEGRSHLPVYVWSSYMAVVGLETDLELTIEGERFYAPAPRVRDWLRENIYGGRTARDLFTHWTWAGFVAACGTMAGLLGWTRRKKGADVDTLKGRRLVDPSTLQLRILGGPVRVAGVPVHGSLLSYKNGGVASLAGIKVPSALLTLPRRAGVHIAGIRIPEDDEPRHMMFLGDTGQGKSTLQRELLYQLREMKEHGAGGPPVVIYDPDREFVREFYVERLDTILNPCDARSPGWDLWAEFRGHSDMLALAKSLIPESDHQNKEYFNQGARAVLVEIIKRCTTKDPRDLSAWLTLPDAEIARLIEGTPAAKYINPKAPQQAAGVTSTLAGWVQVFDALPPLAACSELWSATEWMENPCGWLFLTRRESDEDAVLPLHTVWLDTLIRRTLDRPENASPVWYVLDEITTLRKLNSFPKILERGRKRSARVAFCAQAGAQVEEIYGRRAKSILSQAATQVLFRVQEPSAARWASECIGEREYLDEHTSLHIGDRDGLNVGENRKTSPVVLPSEVQSLKTLTAFFLFDEWVSQVTIERRERRTGVPDFVPRPDAEEWIGSPHLGGLFDETASPEQAGPITDETDSSGDDASPDPLAGLRID